MREWRVLFLLIVTGCHARPEASSSTTSEPSRPVAAARAAPAPVDELDARAALPLLPMMATHQKQNMRDHLLAVQEVVTALAGDDFAAVERAARRLGFSEPMARMCTHMGAAAPGFTERALAFHRTADTIGVAARRHDHSAVVQALGTTLSSCTDCHAAFKQQLVDEATWNELAGAASSPGHEH